MRETLTGWGRTGPSVADVVRAEAPEAVAALLASPPARGVIARGLGRSYGDAAQNAGGAVASTTTLRSLRWEDEGRGLLTVGAGTSLSALIAAVVPRGWFIPVSPGTGMVTVGGAIAADVHGKNHHGDGSFCDHVERLTLATPTGCRELTPGDDPDLFWATAGGLGLTGVTLGATLRLLPVETSRMQVTTARARDLDEAKALLAAGDADHRYSVAWLDALAPPRRLGRSVLSVADHASVADLPAPPPGHGRSAAPPRPALALPSPAGAGPPVLPPGLLHRSTGRAFNELWYRKARPGTGLSELAAFFHPLDAVGGWNRLYGRGGLVQYQFVVPFGAERVVEQALRRVNAAGVPSFLAVLKRFGEANAGPLSFPMPGWTLALDFPARAEGLAACLDALDEEVAGAGGRVYLVKDARLRPELLAAMYPRLNEWSRVRDAVDPEHVLRSDLARRLGL
jgi:decaprenylphospho-beta-D-ribofuranose 2-oxidase